ncbi:MAG: hypothetical protein RL417_518 [Pseudomonadota bacterium]
METLYAPFIGCNPATVTVNGHRVIFLSTDRRALEEGLALLGAESVQPVGTNPAEETADIAAEIAAATRAHPVLTPGEAAVGDVLHSLEAALPWLQ